MVIDHPQLGQIMSLAKARYDELRTFDLKYKPLIGLQSFVPKMVKCYIPGVSLVFPQFEDCHAEHDGVEADENQDRDVEVELERDRC